MGQHHALGIGRGARAVRQRGQMRRRIKAHLRCRALGAEAGTVEHHNLVLGETGPQRSLQSLGQQRVHGDQQAGTGILELFGDVPRGEQRVDRGGGGTGPQDPVERNRETGTVGGQQCHHVADPDTTGGQPAGEGIDPAHQVAVAGFGTGLGIDHGDPVRIGRRHVGEQIVVDADGGQVDVGEWAGETHGCFPFRSRRVV